jgi:hypothetical protein
MQNLLLGLDNGFNSFHFNIIIIIFLKGVFSLKWNKYTLILTKNFFKYIVKFTFTIFVINYCKIYYKIKLYKLIIKEIVYFIFFVCYLNFIFYNKKKFLIYKLFKKCI